MKKQTLTYLLPILFLISACSSSQRSEMIVQRHEIAPFLDEQTFKQASGLLMAQRDLEFWEDKLAGNPESMTYRSKLASAYSRRFAITKRVSDLNHADSLYKLVYHHSAEPVEELAQALAQLSITKHDFKSAEKFGYAALDIGGNTRANNLILFDALMERGDYSAAKLRLNRLGNDFSFGYLVRRSKYFDYEGQLDSAIYYMERAAARMDKRSDLRAWSKSNLGDMYGHANRIADSYGAYLEVVQKENSSTSYLHSLEGIAWIAYAHDKNSALAKDILQFVDEQQQSPDLLPALAEIALYEGDIQQHQEYIRAFVERARRPAYAGMYRTHLIEIAAAGIDSGEWAQRLVEQELDNRPTPETYDWKAWLCLQQDKPEQALQIIQERVAGQTHEPVSAYHMAQIYDANGYKKEARKYYRKALEAEYELGPVTSKKIRAKVNL